MPLGVGIRLPVSPHHYPNRHSLVLLGNLVQALLLGKGFVSSHIITSTSPIPDTSPQQHRALNARLRQVVPVQLG